MAAADEDPSVTAVESNDCGKGDAGGEGGRAQSHSRSRSASPRIRPRSDSPTPQPPETLAAQLTMRNLVLVVLLLLPPQPQRLLFPPPLQQRLLRLILTKTDSREPAGGRFGAIKTLDCCMCMYVTVKYRQIHTDVQIDTYRCQARYMQMRKQRHTPTGKAALARYTRARSYARVTASGQRQTGQG